MWSDDDDKTYFIVIHTHEHIHICILQWPCDAPFLSCLKSFDYIFTLYSLKQQNIFDQINSKTTFNNWANDEQYFPTIFHAIYQHRTRNTRANCLNVYILVIFCRIQIIIYLWQNRQKISCFFFVRLGVIIARENYMVANNKNSSWCHSGFFRTKRAES